MTMNDLRTAFLHRCHCARMVETLEEEGRRLRHELELSERRLAEAEGDLINADKNLANVAFALGDGAYPVLPVARDSLRGVVVMYREPRNLFDRVVQFVYGPQVEIVHVAPPNEPEVNDEA